MAIQELFVELALDMKEYVDGLNVADKEAASFGKRIRDRFDGTFSSISDIAKKGALAVGAGIAAGAVALGALGVSSVGVARDFESAMAIMSTAVDPISVGVETTAEAMGILSDASLAVGSDMDLIGVSASSSAEAMTGLYKAGLTTGEIFGDLQGYLAGTAELGGALRASIDLAAASELDMVAASDLAAVTLATFGGEMETEAERAEFINQAMNNFIQTADASVASVTDLAAAMTNVGPSAAAFGFSLEDVNVALGILSTRGISGSEAGTALKSMMTNMMRTTDDVVGTLKDLNVELYNTDGTMRSLPEIMAQFEAGLVGLTEEERNLAIQTVAGTYGMNAMNALLGEGVAGWEAMEAAVGNAATMQESAAARTNTLAGAQEALAGVWETFQIQVGTALIPILTLLAQVGGQLIDKYGPVMVTVFENVAAGIEKIVEIVQGGRLSELFTIFEDGSSVLGGVFKAFGMGEAQAYALAASISSVVGRAQELLQGAQRVIAPIAAAAAEFVSWQDILIVLGGVIAATVIPAVVGLVLSLAPILITVGAIIAVIALLKSVWEQNGTAILAKAQEVWGGVQAAVEPVIAWLQTNIQAVVGQVIAWWNANWPQIQTTLQAVWVVVQQVIQTAIAIIGPAIQSFVVAARAALGQFALVVPELKALWQSLGPLFQALWPIIQGVLMLIGAALVGLVGVVVGVVSGVSNAIGPLITTFRQVAEHIIQALTGVVDFLTGFVQVIWGFVTNNNDLMLEGFTNMKDGVIDIVNGLIFGLADLIEGLARTLHALIEGLVEGIVEFFQNLYDQLVGNSLVPDLINDIVTWFEDLITWIGDALSNLWATVSEPFIEMWDNLTTWFGEKVTEAIQLGKNLVQGVIDGINEIGQGIVDTISGFVNAAIEAAKRLLGIESPSKVFFEIGINLGLGLIDAIYASIPDAKEAMQALFDEISSVATLGSNFGGVFQSRTLDPLQAQLDGVNSAIEDTTALLSSFLPSNFMDLEAGQQRLLLQRLAGTGFLPANDEQSRARVLLDLLRQRNELQSEYQDAQERILEMQEKQAEFNFLQQQMDLLNLITDRGLGADLVAGLRAALNDPGALVDVMTAALDRMMDAAEDTLGIHSASRWARDTMHNVMSTLMLTAKRETDALRDSLSRALSTGLEPALAVALPGMGNTTTDNSQHSTTYGGRHIHLHGGGRRGSLEDFWEQDL